jgi:hypothetical protein
MIRNVNQDGDWTFGAGLLNYRTGKDELILNLKTRLQSWRNNCFFDRIAGVDYNELLDKGTKPLLDQDVRRVIFQTRGVISIASFESQIVGREYQATIGLNTVYGKLFIGATNAR